MCNADYVAKTNYCEGWLKDACSRLEAATECQVFLILSKKVGPSQFDVMFQIYNASTKHTIIENWFGRAYCKDGAAAKAYEDYLKNCV